MPTEGAEATGLVRGAAPQAHLALRAWDGQGAVRLLEADPARDLLADDVQEVVLHGDLRPGREGRRGLSGRQPQRASSRCA